MKIGYWSFAILTTALTSSPAMINAKEDGSAANRAIILDCRVKSESTISSGKGAEIYKIVPNEGFYIWTDSHRLYSGEGRTWEKLNKSGYCNLNNDNLSFKDSYGSEKYRSECESGYPDFRRKAIFSFDRIDGTLHTSYTGLGGTDYIFNRHLGCETIADPATKPAPATKF